MTDFTEEDRKTLIEIRQILCGNGEAGLANRFTGCQKEEQEYRKEHAKEDGAFRKEFYRFRTWMIATIAVTSGGAGFGLTKLFGS